MTIRTRFAPSPTGDLHLGSVWVALASWVMARRLGGTFVVRIEDLDQPRTVVGAEARLLEDLETLGLVWDGPVVRQSQRLDSYETALLHLQRQGLVYPCDCSRSEIARIASAPHAGEEVLYPGLCREKDPNRPFKRTPAQRLRISDGLAPVSYLDGAFGPVTQSLSAACGDFVLRRGDGIFAYQLAVVVDDLFQGITHVIRGSDLLASTPRQRHLAHLLGQRSPEFLHLGLVVDTAGERLAKRTHGARVRDLLAAGLSPEAILGELAFGLGLAPDNRPRRAEAIAQLSDQSPERWPTAPWSIPRDWATLVDALPQTGTPRPS